MPYVYCKDCLRPVLPARLGLWVMVYLGEAILGHSRRRDLDVGVSPI